MKILITGSSGFVGTRLTHFFLEAGHDVTGVDVAPDQGSSRHPLFQYVRADTTTKGNWQDILNNIDVVINLAGKNIFHRWTKAYKKLIYDTRILTTRHLVEALPDQTDTLFISTSAVGYYGDRKDTVLDENEHSGNDFLARVCVDWEREASKAKSKSARVVITRFGVVLGKNGGALSKMIPAYRLFAGGPLGDGKQWFPWIHIDDLTAAMNYLIEHPVIDGPVNFCASQAVRNIGFSKALARHLNRPAFFRVPAAMLRMAAGELGDMALSSQRAYPKKLLSAGFEFIHPDIDSALSEALN
jgi:uncharacterized protein